MKYTNYYSSPLGKLLMAADDIVTFGLIHHIIEDSKKNEQPPAQNNRRGIYRHYDNTDTRSEAVKDRKSVV